MTLAPASARFFFFSTVPRGGGCAVSSTHARAVARGLHELADDIATLQRPVDGLRRYAPSTSAIPSEYGDALPIVPRAVHDALCPALAVLIHDEDEELVVCDRCKLAVENGAA